MKETEVAYKQFNRSTDQVKNSLGELKNRAKSSEIAFKQSTRSVDSYKDHLTTMNYTISKSKGNIDLLKRIYAKFQTHMVLQVDKPIN